MYLFDKTKKANTYLELVQYGNIAYSVNIQNIEIHKIPITYEFAIISQYNMETKIAYKQIYSEDMFNKLLETDSINSLSFIESTITFMAIDIILSDDLQPITIELKTSNRNFYIVNNVLNHVFFKFFLKEYHKSQIKNVSSEIIENMKIKVVDHNADIIEFDSKTKTIVIKESDYILMDV
jgi:hypothetical protein